MSIDPVNIRQHLHAHPELSGKEEQTANYIFSVLEKVGCNSIQRFSNHGLIAHFGPVGAPTILFRADFDALPIPEELDISYKSKRDGVSHKCGHDGHTAILLDVAQHIAENPPQHKNVALLFQPAEETGAGAHGMLSDKVWNLEPESVWALHNIPGEPMGEVISRAGAFSASVRTLVAELKGVSSHAAEPQKGVNPALAMSELTRYFYGIENRMEGPNYRLITPVYQRLGEKAYGTSPGDAEVAYTLRTFDEDQMQSMVKMIEQYLSMMSKTYGLKVDWRWEEVFPASTNTERAVASLKKAVQNAGMNFTEKEFPFSWGEDFGYFLNQYPGAMFGIGSGEQTAPLHHPEYDFPDALIPRASAIFRELIRYLDQNEF